MAHKAEGIMSTQVLRNVDDWDAFRTLMILNDETHLTLSIDDVDRLLEGAGSRADARIRALETQVRRATASLEGSRAALRGLNERLAVAESIALHPRP